MSIEDGLREGENPTRRYKSFRPRQAARGSIVPASSVNSTTLTLFNNSNGAQYLVVRDYQVISANNPGMLGFAYLQGLNGLAGGTIQPLIPATAAPPGVLTTFDTATVFPLDFVPAQGFNNFTTGYHAHDYPIAILPPGWSLVVQDGVNKGITNASFVWEAVFADELDFWN